MARTKIVSHGCTEQRADAAGALVLSLDFELHWGVRDIRPLDAAERRRLRSARELIPRLLALFQEFDIHATWATVGFLFARTRDELEYFSPVDRPHYLRSELDPYRERIGANETEDPFHYGASLLEQIALTPGQEIASHSFSHYYCLEPEFSVSAFEADLNSALAIARQRNYKIRSYVFPRNQVHPDCLPSLAEAGICYRAAAPDAVNVPGDYAEQRRPYKRLARLADAYLDLFGANVHSWPEERAPVSLAASRYLAPYRPWLAAAEEWRRQRILKAMAQAAAEGKIFHLWWHPEDFATQVDCNLAFLRSLLLVFAGLRGRHAMRSLTMAEAAASRGASASALPEFAALRGEAV